MELSTVSWCVQEKQRRGFGRGEREEYVRWRNGEGGGERMEGSERRGEVSIKRGAEKSSVHTSANANKPAMLQWNLPLADTSH